MSNLASLLRFFSAFLLLVQLSAESFSQVVDRVFARKIAESVLIQSGVLPDTKGSGITDSLTISDSSALPVMYLYSGSKGGFVILAADKRAYPLLAFSAGSQFLGEEDWFSDSLSQPPAFKEWIENRTSEIAYIRKHNLAPSPEVSEMWDLISKGVMPDISGSKGITPLLKTTWNQTCGYNAMCPVDSRGPCGRVVTGCVATAMAQVIRYNAHPVNGTGSRCYNTSLYGELCADFSTAGFNYAIMPDNSGNTEVAKLMYYCGVSVSMNYGPYGSSAYSSAVAHAMRTWFDYTNGLILGKSSYSETVWERILINEFQSGRVVYYSGFGTSGHAFVLDGYQESNHFHVNWGWGGSYNGYFYLSALNPGSMNFSSGQQGIIGMVPVSGFTGPDFASAVSLECKTKVNASIADGTDYVNYYRNIWPATPGKELLFKFTTSLPGRIRIKISNQTGSVYTFLLNKPDKDSLVTYGTNGIVAENTLPGTYWVVTEGYAGNEPSFTIEVICPSTDADLDIQTASVAPEFIESLQPNVSFLSRVKNIGNSVAASTSMEYYLSSDQTFEPASDIYLGNSVISALQPGNYTDLSAILNMPGSLAPGSYYVLFVADRIDIVTETDEENVFAVSVNVPAPGILDCTSSFALTDNVWFRGNTGISGMNRVEKYNMGWEMTGPEVIHSFTPLNNGLVNITFTEKSPGKLYALVLPVCNENSGETSLVIYNLTDTITEGKFYAVGGTQYILVVDGQYGAEGDYGLLVDLPSECPVVKVDVWGKTDLCDGDRWPSFSAFWGYSNYKWFRDDIPVPGATNSSFTPSATGSYHLVVIENGCAGSSPKINIRMDPPPDTAIIINQGDTIFCDGGSTQLTIKNSVTFPYNWAKDDLLLPGATSGIYTAEESGVYSLYTINGACSVKSANQVEVRSVDLPVGAGEKLPIPSGKIIFHNTFTPADRSKEGGTGNISGNDYEPADDRFGNFWQACYLRGEDQKIYSPVWDSIPRQFSVGLWFRTSTLNGGVLAGFYDNPWNPTLMDALLYMGSDGKLHFWLSNNGAPVELVTSKKYNDDKWHCVVVRHNEKMILQVDDNAEFLESPGSVKKRALKGYWTFGGPSLPPGVNQMPSSLFLEAVMDDLIALSESNAYLMAYLFRNPSLEAYAIPEIICSSGVVSFELPFTEPGVEYRVWSQTDGSWYTGGLIGDGGAMALTGSAEINRKTTFNIIGRDIVTGCERVVAVSDKSVELCTGITNGESSNGVKVYPVPASEVIYFESSDQLTTLKIFNSTGHMVYASGNARSDIKEVIVAGWPDGIYLYQILTGNGVIITGKIIIADNYSP